MLEAIRSIVLGVLKHVAVLLLGAVSVFVTFIGMLAVLGMLLLAIVHATVPADLIQDLMSIVPARVLEQGRLVAGVCLLACVLWLSWGTGSDLVRAFGGHSGTPMRVRADGVLRVAWRQIARTALGAVAVVVTGAGLCAAGMWMVAGTLWALFPELARQLAHEAVVSSQFTPMVIFGSACLAICALWLCWSVGYGLDLR